MTAAPRPHSADVLLDRKDGILDRQQTLERRLDDGYRRIEAALRSGADVDAWETFWIGLLHEYEEVCDDLRLAA